MGRRFTISLLIILHETSIPSSVESVSCCYMNILATMTFFLHMSIAIVHTPLKLSDADVGLAQGIFLKAFFHGTSPFIYISIQSCLLEVFFSSHQTRKSTSSMSWVSAARSKKKKPSTRRFTESWTRLTEQTSMAGVWPAKMGEPRNYVPLRMRDNILAIPAESFLFWIDTWKCESVMSK